MSPFCLYDLKQETPGGRLGIKKIRNLEYLESHLSREKYTFGALCMMLSQVGTEGQIHAMEKKQWKMIKSVKRAGHEVETERPYEDESVHEPTDQDDSDSDADYDFDEDSDFEDDNGSDGIGSTGNGVNSIISGGSEVDDENDGGYNEDDEVQVDAE
ncbi:hypothetical protein L486_05133 [Kwoniella mangroviensis CBS 10435]|uniref:Uncharacterized protein n=1 Tax=Kwoniella mangroviensis CBS 10435 TaxID=1331196 RepID=A0A1B9IQ87_9TREE|nr:uncharacterized protein I203_00132 [Kwoniella mangroviensis CBS 8507]OCF57671.1 hypothetical protein L486_05133 [Kwoniella mangroviensis CBS 10435]OCF70003.1 hypothetical protein I203_00132 [Kwoniella mangroviensis CBS 8507]OCF75781.1 hypothetical protein I204_03075 [Kwoniella mangroviensis CBS 8886]